MARKSWQEKLNIAKERRVVDVPLRMQRQLGGPGKLLIPHPLDVDTAIRRIPEGRVVTTGELRRQLAHEFGADTTCPMCTGMFLRIVAEASEERKAGKTPYWRVVGDDGKLNPKLPGGVAAQAAALRREGHTIKPGAQPRLTF
jgi:alkylated DNA nucleotide flippase Atl1